MYRTNLKISLLYVLSPKIIFIVVLSPLKMFANCCLALPSLLHCSNRCFTVSVSLLRNGHPGGGSLTSMFLKQLCVGHVCPAPNLFTTTSSLLFLMRSLHSLGSSLISTNLFLMFPQSFFHFSYSFFSIVGYQSLCSI